MSTLPLFAPALEAYKVITAKVNVTLLPTSIRKFISFQHCERKGVTGDCWIWNGFRFQGYGRLTYRGFKTRKAHRIVYQLLLGPIPDGLEIDHLCVNPPCVNPNHLEPVTRAENLRRTHITGNGNGTRTHCRQGHEFTPKNIYHWRGKRFCLACQRIRQAKYENRKAGVA